MTAALRRWPARLAAVLAIGVVVAGCGAGARTSAGTPGPPSAYLGTVTDRPVPAGIAGLPLTTDAGRPTSLRAWRGQVVVLADFLTLCQETCPPGTDWLTGRTLNYDVAHEDALLYLDASGRVRFVVVGGPNASGAPVAPALRRFLSAQGRANLCHPDASTWTAAEALGPIAWLTGRPIPLPGS